MNEYSQEFKLWYERHFLQSPSLCKLEYDDEKMWEAWKAAKQWQGLSEDELLFICEDFRFVNKEIDGNMAKFAKAIEQKLKEKNT